MNFRSKALKQTFRSYAWILWVLGGHIGIFSCVTSNKCVFATCMRRIGSRKYILWCFGVTCCRTGKKAWFDGARIRLWAHQLAGICFS